MITDRVCVSCGKEFRGGPRAWRCPECRIERNKFTSAQHKERKTAGKSRLLGSTDLCKICGRPYTVEAGTQMYCKECVPEQYKKTDREQSIDWYRREKETINPKRNDRRRIQPKTCLVCGKVFEAHTKSVCCSPECRRRRINDMWNERARRKRKAKKAEMNK